MKIKRKVEMNEKELIKHLVNHESTTIYFSGISYDGAWLSIEPEIESKVHFELKDVSENGKAFTVEVEEVVDEDTKFRHIVFIDDCGLSASWGNSSINDIKYGKDKEYHAYIEGEFKLIWRDGKLVK